MKSLSKLNNVRIGHKKLNLPARFIRRICRLDKVIANLSIRSNKSFNLISSAVKSARSNMIIMCAKGGYEFKDSDYNVDVQIGRGGKSMKRYMPRAKGSANIITKETSHISVFITKNIGGITNGK
jgi:large subunit ribosomal protein L22